MKLGGEVKDIVTPIRREYRRLSFLLPGAHFSSSLREGLACPERRVAFRRDPPRPRLALRRNFPSHEAQSDPNQSCPRKHRSYSRDANSLNPFRGSGSGGVHFQLLRQRTADSEEFQLGIVRISPGKSASVYEHLRLTCDEDRISD
jgi:hypothetical protein